MISFLDLALWLTLFFTINKMVHWYRVAETQHELNKKLNDKIAELETIIIIHGIKNESKH